MSTTDQIVTALASTAAVFLMVFFVWGYVYDREWLLAGWRRSQWPPLARMRRQEFKQPKKTLPPPSALA